MCLVKPAEGNQGPFEITGQEINPIPLFLPSHFLEVRM